MKDEYDFSNGQRGRFYRPDAVLNSPVHLDPEVLAFLAARAEARGVSLSELPSATSGDAPAMSAYEGQSGRAAEIVGGPSLTQLGHRSADRP